MISERLKDLRVQRGLTLEQLAEQTGLSRAALGRYESDDCKEISPTAVVTLAKFYGVSADYLLGLTETKNHSNTDLHDLHLSDDMVTLLSSGKINNRLLCEIATHENFQRLMTDDQLFLQPGLGLEEVAARLKSNKTYISKMVNQTYGIGFPEVLNILRVDYAQQYMLKHKDASQEEIARASGFLSASSFNTVFKRITGYTPKVWSARK